MGHQPAPPRTKYIIIMGHSAPPKDLHQSSLTVSKNVSQAWSLAWPNEVFCFPEKGKVCARDSAQESFCATQNSTASSCFQFITSVSSWITNTATRTLQMPLPNTNSQRQKITIFKKFLIQSYVHHKLVIYSQTQKTFGAGDWALTTYFDSIPALQKESVLLIPNPLIRFYTWWMS